MLNVRALVVGLSLVGSSLAACGGGGPCGKAVEAAAKFGSAEEKAMASEKKDDFVKLCEMGLKQSPDMAKVVECQAKAADEAAYKACH